LPEPNIMQPFFTTITYNLAGNGFNGQYNEHLDRTLITFPLKLYK